MLNEGIIQLLDVWIFALLYLIKIVRVAITTLGRKLKDPKKV